MATFSVTLRDFIYKTVGTIGVSVCTGSLGEFNRLGVVGKFRLNRNRMNTKFVHHFPDLTDNLQESILVDL